MSRHFGEIRQLGYVVHDIEAAMDYWSKTLGVGPWYYNPKVPIVNYEYDGQSYEPHNSVALANSGFVQVELIQTRNDAPSMYRDFREAGHRGLLQALDLPPLLDLGMRLGEGSGACLAVNILRSALECHTGMASFAEAGVSEG